MHDHLLKAVLPLHPYSVCNASYTSGVPARYLPRGVLDESQLCSGDLKDKKDTCQVGVLARSAVRHEDFFD